MEKKLKKHNLNIKNIDINLIKLREDNPRLHSEEQIKQIANSIEEFGFVNPILIDEDNNILAGHGRFKASETLNLQEVPTLKIEDLTTKQKKALVIADNKITLNSNWDVDLLWKQVKELNSLDFNLDILGFDHSEVLPMLDNNAVTDFSNEWENMPEFIQEDAQAYRTIKVHFNTDRDVEVFSKLIGQKLTDKTKSIWHPQQEKNDTETKRYD